VRVAARRRESQRLARAHGVGTEQARAQPLEDVALPCLGPVFVGERRAGAAPREGVGDVAQRIEAQRADLGVQAPVVVGGGHGRG